MSCVSAALCLLFITIRAQILMLNQRISTKSGWNILCGSNAHVHVKKQQMDVESEILPGGRDITRLLELGW